MSDFRRIATELRVHGITIPCQISFRHSKQEQVDLIEITELIAIVNKDNVYDLLQPTIGSVLTAESKKQVLHVAEKFLYSYLTNPEQHNAFLYKQRRCATARQGRHFLN